MFKPVRIVATIVFLVSVALVFVGAFAIGNQVRPLSIYPLYTLIPNCRSSVSVSPPHHRLFPFHTSAVFVIIEYLAYTWYCLSYIPYARSAILRVVGLS